MPNRILRDYTDSPAFDGLSAEAERLFIRLIMKADDYGRFHANPKLVKAACFPLAEDLRANTVAAWLTELSDRQLVFCYTSGTGSFLQIPKFGEPRAKSSKYPPPPDGCDHLQADASICDHLQADAIKCPRIRLSPIASDPNKQTHGREGDGKLNDPPTEEQALAYAANGATVPISRDCVLRWLTDREVSNWLKPKGNHMIEVLPNWQADLRGYAMDWNKNEHERAARQRASGPGSGSLKPTRKVF